MHTDLIPAYEMITGGDPEWGTPGHSAKAQNNAGAFDETNPWGKPVSTNPWDANPGTPTVQTNAWGQPVTPPDQPKTGSSLSPSPTVALSATSPFPKKRLGILDQIRGLSHTKPASLPGSTSTNLPSYTPPKVYETYKPWQPYTPPASLSPTLTATSPWNPTPASSSLSGLTGQPDLPGASTAPLPTYTPWGTEPQPARRVGILDKSLVKQEPGQNPWAENISNSAEAVTGSAETVLDMLGKSAPQQMNNLTDLRSGTAGNSLQAGIAIAAQYGESGNAAQNQSDEVAGKTSTGGGDYDPNVNIRHIPGSDTYIWTPPGKGSRNVTPFKDQIPGFDWHRDRNRFNRAPRVQPQPVMKDIKTNDGMVAVVSHYKDHLGDKWTRDSFVNWYNHGVGNSIYRGTGRNLGCQAVYTFSGGHLVDSGSKLGTYDYGRPISLRGAHNEMDMQPHRNSPNYTPNLTEVF